MTSSRIADEISWNITTVWWAFRMWALRQMAVKSAFMLSTYKGILPELRQVVSRFDGTVGSGKNMGNPHPHPHPHPQIILNSNVSKSRPSTTTVLVIKSFWNFVQSTAVILSCSVQNLKMIWQLSIKLRRNEISRDLSSVWILEWYSSLQ